jgi:hypothetical protein
MERESRIAALRADRADLGFVPAETPDVPGKVRQWHHTRYRTSRELWPVRMTSTSSGLILGHRRATRADIVATAAVIRIQVRLHGTPPRGESMGPRGYEALADYRLYVEQSGRAPDATNDLTRSALAAAAQLRNPLLALAQAEWCVKQQSDNHDYLITLAPAECYLGNKKAAWARSIRPLLPESVTRHTGTSGACCS